MSQQLDEIFAGIPPSACRNALAAVARNLKPDKVVVPFAGRFAAAELLMKAVPGVRPEQFYTSDISLFSSTLGFLYSNQPLKQLGVEFSDEKLKFLEEDIDEGGVKAAAAILFAIKYSQLASIGKYYFTSAARAMIYEKEKFIGVMRHRLNALVKTMSGLHYEIADARGEIQKWSSHENSFMFLNPPAYQMGYAKLFPFKNFLSWNEPSITQFIDEDIKAMIDSLEQARIHAILLAIDFPSKNNIDWFKPSWDVFFTHRYPSKVKKHIYLASNRATGQILTKRAVSEAGPMDAPVYNDEILNKYTKVGIKPLTKEQAIYYRDLWVHKLGATSAEMNFAMFLDGRIFTVFGLMSESAYRIRGDRQYVHELYGISCPSKRWLRLNRLFMRLLLSYETRDWLLQTTIRTILPLDGVKTVCISRFPEVRLNNGLLKREGYKKIKNNQYFVTYYSSFHEKSYRQNIVEFLDEEARLRRIKQNGSPSRST